MRTGDDGIYLYALLALACCGMACKLRSIRIHLPRSCRFAPFKYKPTFSPEIVKAYLGFELRCHGQCEPLALSLASPLSTTNVRACPVLIAPHDRHALESIVFVVFGHLGPVDNVPPLLDVRRPKILVLQVVPGADHQYLSQHFAFANRP